MTQTKHTRWPHFTVFRSAAEEVNDRRAMNEWLDKGRDLFAKSDQVAAKGSTLR